MKALIVGSTNTKTDTIPYAQIYPFFSHRRLLRSQLGLTIQHAEASTITEIEAACRAKADIFFIRPSWREDATEVERVMRQIRNQHPSAIIVFIDPFDQTSSRFFGVLPYVDRFLKYQGLRDKKLYSRSFVGGTFLTNVLAEELGYDLKDWHVGSEVPQGYEHRIETGWYVSLLPDFKKPLFKKSILREQPAKRSIDLFCHVSYGPRNNLEWYGQHRIEAIGALQRLASDYRLSVSGDYTGEKRAISSRQYFADIKQSRIVVSPFGWGEITLRDYEAACYGCLLIKPDVEHIDVAPDIFIPGETYIPVRWDFADLEEKCRYYLERPDEISRITNNARQVYMNYFNHNQFVQKIANLIQAVKPYYPLTITRAA
ncbi:MAG: hypothetical protein Kow00121_25180 [Elainellaceae cyanobacterium]